MSPEGSASLVRAWVGLYTRGLSAAQARQRIAELDADLADQIDHDRSRGIDDRSIARSIRSRMVRGLLHDAAWRLEAGWRIAEHATAEEAERFGRIAYRRALLVGAGALLVLVWGIGALGIIGTEGDGNDRLYLAVLGTAVVGSLVSRLRSGGMARTLLAMAAVQAVVTVVAVVGGLVPSYNPVAEVVLLNLSFIVLYVASAWLFRRASLRRRLPSPPPT